MKHLLILIVGFLFIAHAQAQFKTSKYTIVDDMEGRMWGEDHKLSKKAANSNKTCGKDTITYPYFKASRLVTINVSNGYSLGQFYEAPGKMTISGFEFYAFQTSQNSDTVELYCEIYKAGADSLPTGSPLRADTLLIDSTFGGGALSALRQSAEFNPLVYDSAYIVVLRTVDTANRVAVVSSDWQANDGDLENLACGSISNLWYHFLDLNISGRTLNCDMLIHPYVEYKYYNDFSFTDCYTFGDTVKFKNTSSPFYHSRMYNRYVFFNLDYFCHLYRYENRLYRREVEGAHRYTSRMNDTVRMISTIYTFTGGRTCLDTVEKGVTHLPLDINFSGDRNLCAGDFSLIRTNTPSTVEWFKKPTDPKPFLTNNRYSTPNLYANDTLYAQAVNGSCRTPLKSFAIEVTPKPNILTVVHDSVCLNSKANLSAKSDIGVMNWFADSSANFPVFSGNVLQTTALSNDTSFFVRAFNKHCTSDGYVRVNALVSKDFAPQEPQVVHDTTICLQDGMVNIMANANDPIRWYTLPSGGTPFQNGGNYSYSPLDRGDHLVYVDAYDGRCASSRVPVKITTHHFPTLPTSLNEKVCEEDSILMDFSQIHGTIDWFEGKTNPNPLFTGKSGWFRSAGTQQTFYLLAREGFCLDTVRHPFQLTTTPLINAEYNGELETCAGNSLSLKSDHTGGTTYWLGAEDTVVHMGNPYLTPVLERQSIYKAFVSNDGCIGDTLLIPIEVLPSPNSNYDFQINVFRSVLFQAKVANQGTYIWDFDDLGQTKTGRLVNHDFSDDRDFNVQLKVTSPQGCADSTSKIIRIENTGSIADPEAENVRVYPNPVRDQLHIKLEEGHRYQDIRISDALGRIIWSSNTEKGIANNFWLNTSDLPSGTYTVHFEGDTDKAHMLIVKP